MYPRELGLCILLFLLNEFSLFESTYHLEVNLKEDCPDIYLEAFLGFAPKGNVSAGNYIKKDSVFRLTDCLAECCSDPLCNVVFMHGTSCLHIRCFNDDLCIPIERTESQFEDVTMILVKPVSSLTWEEILKQNENFQKEESDPPSQKSLERCQYGSYLACPLNEECVPYSPGSLHSFCHCKQGFIRDNTHTCVLLEQQLNLHKNLSTLSDTIHTLNDDQEKWGSAPKVQSAETTTSIKPPKKLVVSVLSKEVRLPENEVTLSAYVVPAESNGEHYNYVWKLLSQPGVNSGTMNDQNGGTLKLSHLVEGLYQFKVIVSGSGSYGETYANVSVLPPKRINQPPIAIITPMTQTVKMPNTGAVLDGSTSKDDDSIINWHWELQQGPIGYQPHLIDTPTLQLDNLIHPGNYTFKLTVEDSDHATNSTTATITVLKVTDYPPEANAGQDIIIYLPHNNITLNGNLSTDDRGIASWEWTKSSSDQNKAVDMQNTRTPYLQLSNLEEGMYTFVLKVTDTSGQSSLSEIHVFVKPPTNKPPVADAGKNVTLVLPKSTVTLNGSKSTDDIKIVAWQWHKIKGPSNLVFSAANQSITNVSDFTKGEYEIELIVTDNDGNKASDTLHITVVQNQNARPHANGGGDQTLVLPLSVIILNGSKSTDDLGITKWEWKRDPNSLAMGRIIGNSDHEPVLMITDVVPGRYVFKLIVTDDQGLSDEDQVSIIVKPDPHLLDLVELILNIEGHRFIQNQQDSLEQKLSLLLRGKVTIHVRELRLEDRTGRAVLVFYVEQNNSIMRGPEVVKTLKEKLKQDSGLLELSIANIQTIICQNNCSGHGVCDQASRQCLCEAFWMQNLLVKYFGNEEANCDWSILYVMIVLFTGVVLIVGSIWGIICFLQEACSNRPRKKAKYSLLEESESDKMILREPYEKVVLSDSDTDMDVWFESRKANGVCSNDKERKKNMLKSPHRINA